MIHLPELEHDAPECFPNPVHALDEPNGLLALGGDLSPQRLLAAYARGIFPWYSETQPILWWSPDPRCVFDTSALSPNRSLRRQLAHSTWQFSVDHAFEEVINACARKRPGQSESWITADMIDAYTTMHAQGHTHSVEVWNNASLIGGIYGVAMGRMFFGESMFSRESGGSKAALTVLGALLRDWGYPLLDAQIANPHLLALGAHDIPRREFLNHLHNMRGDPKHPSAWHQAPRRPLWAFLSTRNVKRARQESDETYLKTQTP